MIAGLTIGCELTWNGAEWCYLFISHTLFITEFGIAYFLIIYNSCMFLSLHLEHSGNRNNLFFIPILLFILLFSIQSFRLLNNQFLWDKPRLKLCKRNSIAHSFFFRSFFFIVYRIKIIKIILAIHSHSINHTHIYANTQNINWIIELVMLQTHVCAFFSSLWNCYQE